jgi:hypothetical protein
MPVLQVVKFRIKAETEPSTFEALDARFQREVAPHMEGLLRRESACAPEGDWVIVNLWADRASAMKPPTANLEFAKAAMSHVDPSTAVAAFYDVKSH